MKRRDKIYESLLGLWTKADAQQVRDLKGSTTLEIAKLTGYSRSNCSSELNHLVTDRKVVKIQTYPVRYIPSSILIKTGEQIPGDFVVQKVSKKEKPNEIGIKHSDDPFSKLIGADQSLRKAIKQAKTAIMYPPHGLDMLLLGPTGSGKTFFANVSYQFAKYAKQIPANAPFIVFNCADYYNNAQLLLSQIFGHVKGSYTGADTSEAGIVEKADGGILLLDEVHRLPPEGQEMLFTFMDTGHFARLGESEKTRTANVLIIAATNENPHSNLLATFLRRIPTVINIPALSEKGIREKVQIVNYLFRQEATRIQRDLDVNISVIESILFASNYGNIGQLKSQIKLICARAFLNNLNTEGDLLVNTSCLPEEIQAVSASRQTDDQQKQLTTIVPQHTIYSFDSNSRPDILDDNIYIDIAKKVNELRAQRLPENKIQSIVMQGIRGHIRSFLKDPVESAKLENFISPSTLKLTLRLREIAEELLKEHFDHRFLYYIGMHIDTYLARGYRDEKLLMETEISRIKYEYAKEYAVALAFKNEIAQADNVYLPDIEVVYLTLLLSSLRQMSKEKARSVGILVVAHGNSTATSMVEVTKELLGESNIDALDMPLNCSPTEMAERIARHVESLNEGLGVLLLVDMGSLFHLEEQIEQKTSVPIKILPYVTTITVLDTVRKANYLNMNLSSLYHSIWNDFLETVTTAVRSESSALPKAILSICMTGTGTAERLKTIIVNIINLASSEPIQVKTISALELKAKIPTLSKKYDILATVGTKKPNLPVPHISLETLISGNGETLLRSIIGHQAVTNVQPKGPSTIVPAEICRDVLEKNLIYFNPYLMTRSLISWTEDLARILNLDFSNSTIVKCVVHTSFAFERSLRNETVKYPYTATPEVSRISKAVTRTLQPYEDDLKVKLTEDEIYYISEIVVDDQGQSLIQHA